MNSIISIALVELLGRFDNQVQARKYIITEEKKEETCQYLERSVPAATTQENNIEAKSLPLESVPKRR